MTDVAARPASASSYRQGVILVLLGSLASSWMGLGVRLMDEASAWQILVFRSSAATAFVLLVILLTNPGHLRDTFRNALRATLIGGTGIAIAFSAVIVAFQLTTIANTLFVLAVSPFLAAVLGRIVLGERVRAATWVAIAVSLIGVAIMVFDDLSLDALWGEIAAGIAALGLAVFLVALRSEPELNMLPVAAFGGGLGTVAALFVCFVITNEGLVLPTHDIVLGLILGVFQLGLALCFVTWGARHVPAAEVALLNVIEVVLGPLWVWLAFGESAGPLTLIGGALVLAAVIGDTLSGEHARRRRKKLPA